MPICKRCGKEAEHYKSVTSSCKECWKAHVRAYRERHKDRVQAYDRNRPNREQRIERNRERYARAKENPGLWSRVLASAAAWREAHADRRRAHVIVGNAIRDGKLAVQPCEVCGYAIGVHAHHEDYCKPLEVRWLCVRHHGERHRQINEQRRGAA